MLMISPSDLPEYVQEDLSLYKIIDWLKAFGSDQDVVGMRSSPGSCPISWYLSSIVRNGERVYKHISTMYRYTTFWTEDGKRYTVQFHELPPNGYVLGSFINEVDSTYFPFNLVHRSSALRIAKSIAENLLEG